MIIKIIIIIIIKTISCSAQHGQSILGTTKFTDMKRTTFSKSILLTFNITDSLITCSDGVFITGELVLGCNVEPSAVGVMEAFCFPAE